MTTRTRLTALRRDSAPGIFYGWIVVAASFLATISIYGGRFSFGVFFEPLQQEFGWTRAVTAGAFSMVGLVHGLFSFPMGWACDRYGPKKVIALGISMGGLGLVLSSTITAAWQLYLYYGLLLGLGTASCSAPVFSTVSRWFVKRRGLALGIATTGFSAGMVIMAPLARYLISVYQWREAYLIIGVIVWVVSIPAVLFIARDPSKKKVLPYGVTALEGQVGPSKSHSGGLSLRKAMGTRTLWLIYAAAFTSMMVYTMVVGHIVRYAMDRGMSPVKGAFVLSLVGLFSVAGRVGLGFASDALGRKLTLVISAVAVGLTMLWLMVASDAWMFYLFALVFGLFAGGSPVLLSGAQAEFFGIRSIGTILGASGIAIALGGATGPLLAGYIFDVTGSYSIVFLSMAVASLGAAVCTLFVRPETQT